MADKYLYFTGKAKWARTRQPDLKYNQWSIDLYMIPESLERFKQLPIKTHVKSDPLDGEWVRLKRPVEKNYRNGKKIFTAPAVVDKDNKPINDLIGNGSDVTCKVELYSYQPPNSKLKEFAIRLEAVRVNNLVPYEPKKDFDPDLMEKAGEFVERPIEGQEGF